MSYELTDADVVWNRAAMENGGDSPASGDLALASLLYAHGMVMNGGVLHAVELLAADELSDAQDGFRFFDLVDVADLLSQARNLFDKGESLNEFESRVNREYLRLVPTDSFLIQQFESRFRENSSEFSPVA